MRTCRLALVLLLVASFVSAADKDAKSSAPVGKLTPAKRLAREVPLMSLAKVPLVRVLTQYEKLSGLIMQADWQALSAAGVTKETPVTLKARKVSFEKLLDLTVDVTAKKGQPLAWRRNGSTVFISTQMGVLTKGRETRPVSLATLRDRLPARVGKTKVTVRRGRGRAVRGATINFDHTPLSQSLDFIRDLAGVNMHVNWRALEETGVSKETTITLKVAGVAPGQALDLILDQLNVGRDRLGSIYWVVQGGVVHVATGDILNRTTTVRIFDVGTLLMPVPNFKGPRISLEDDDTGDDNESSGGLFGDNDGGDSGDGGGSGRGEEVDLAEQRLKMELNLIEIIKSSIGEEMWQPTGVGSIRVMRNRLIISQTPLGFKLLGKSLGG